MKHAQLLLVIASAILTLSTDAEISCRHGYVKLNDGCYYFENSQYATWTEARTLCEMNGAKLISVESADEHEAIRSYLKKYSCAYSSTGLWTSGNDLADRGNWLWETTQESLKQYSGWGKGEPNNSGGNQRCVKYYTYPGHYQLQWDDEDCAQKNKFICEQDADPTLVGL